MKRTVLLLASITLAALFSSVVLISVAIHSARAQPSGSKPNIVFILTDDMRYDDLKYMPKTKRLLGAEGMTFSRAFVTNPLCCPARATIMRGQYAHNTGVWMNGNKRGKGAGFRAYRANGLDKDNVATRLNGAGYETALFGKYIHGYRKRTVPPGWDRWFSAMTTGTDYYNYRVNDDGNFRRYGNSRENYLTDVLARQAQRFIWENSWRNRPFFAYVAPTAPHQPATPARRHEHAHDGLKAPKGPSFNEGDVSDKPPWIKGRKKLKGKAMTKMNRLYERRAESLLAVDDMVGGIVKELRKTGQLGNTYIFFTSDNGWHLGEHRIPRGKARPYEEDIRVPLLVRGPGITPGSETNRLALNTDYLPTFTDLAGTSEPPYVDGRSLEPVLRRTAGSWRTAILVEGRKTPEGGSTPAFKGVRTTSEKYVEYKGGKKEFYKLERDPYELRSKRSVPSWLSSRLKDLKDCRRAGCRRAEN